MDCKSICSSGNSSLECHCGVEGIKYLKELEPYIFGLSLVCILLGIILWGAFNDGR